jgi:hypothetical protein
VWVGSQDVGQPKTNREQARIHQLMDLGPNLAVTAQHALS